MVPEELLKTILPLRTVKTFVNSMFASGPWPAPRQIPHGNSVASVDEVADRFHGVGVPGLAELLD